MSEIQFAANAPTVVEKMQFVKKDPELIATVRAIRQYFIEERGLIQPSFDPTKQLELHGQLGYLMGQIMLCDDMLLALTLPPVPQTEEN